MSAEHDNHGQTPAAWTTAVIVMMAFVVGTIGVVIAQPIVFWVGVAMIPAGLLIGKIMAGMGYGAQGSHGS